MSESAFVETKSGQIVWADAIDARLLKIEDAKEDLKNLKEMLDSALESDDEYLQAEGEFNSTKLKLKAATARVHSDNSDLLSKIDAKKEELKDLKESLSMHVVEYHRETQLTRFTSKATGYDYEIKLNGKLKKIS